MILGCFGSFFFPLRSWKALLGLHRSLLPSAAGNYSVIPSVSSDRHGETIPGTTPGLLREAAIPSQGLSHRSQEMRESKKKKEIFAGRAR